MDQGLVLVEGDTETAFHGHGLKTECQTQENWVSNGSSVAWDLACSCAYPDSTTYKMDEPENISEPLGFNFVPSEDNSPSLLRTKRRRKELTHEKCSTITWLKVTKDSKELGTCPKVDWP